MRPMPAEVQGFVRKTRIKFPMLHDPKLLVSQQYGVQALPATFFAQPIGRGDRCRDRGETLGFAADDSDS